MTAPNGLTTAGYCDLERSWPGGTVRHPSTGSGRTGEATGLPRRCALRDDGGPSFDGLRTNGGFRAHPVFPANAGIHPPLPGGFRIKSAMTGIRHPWQRDCHVAAPFAMTGGHPSTGSGRTGAPTSRPSFPRTRESTHSCPRWIPDQVRDGGGPSFDGLRTNGGRGQRDCHVAALLAMTEGHPSTGSGRTGEATGLPRR